MKSSLLEVSLSEWKGMSWVRDNAKLYRSRANHCQWGKDHLKVRGYLVVAEAFIWTQNEAVGRKCRDQRILFID